MNPLELEWPPCLLPPSPAPEVHRKMKAALGYVPAAVEYTGCVPWVAEISRLVAILPVRVLDAATVDLCAVAATHATTCRHCYGAVRAAMLLLGYSEEQVQALSDQLYGDAVPPKIRDSAEYVRRIITLEATRADIEGLRKKGFSEDEIKDLTAVGSISTTYSRITTPLAVPPAPIEKTQRSFFAPLVGFFMRLGNAKAKKAWREKISEASDAKGAFEKLLAPLLPSPAVREFRALIEECLRSTMTSRRARLLAMGVVGRGARAPIVEAEARRLLAEDGVPSAQADAAIERLESSDPFERGLLAYARTSVSYRPPAEIQAVMREFGRGVPPPQLVDVMGAVALANGLSRLSVLLPA